MFMLGMTRLVEMIGEAANWIPREVQEQYPDIPWANIVGMRNRIIHEYDKVDLDILWQTAKERLPELVKALNEALNFLELIYFHVNLRIHLVLVFVYHLTLLLSSCSLPLLQILVG